MEPVQERVNGVIGVQSSCTPQTLPKVFQWKECLHWRSTAVMKGRKEVVQVTSQHGTQMPAVW